MFQWLRKSAKSTALAAGIAAALASSSCSLHSVHETERELKLGKPAVVLLKKQEDALNNAQKSIATATVLLKFAETYRTTGELAYKVGEELHKAGEELQSLERLQDALRVFTREQEALNDAERQLEGIKLDNVYDDLEKLKLSIETSGKDVGELQHALTELEKAIAEKKILTSRTRSAIETGQMRIKDVTKSIERKIK